MRIFLIELFEKTVDSGPVLAFAFAFGETSSSGVGKSGNAGVKRQ